MCSRDDNNNGRIQSTNTSRIYETVIGWLRSELRMSNHGRFCVDGGNPVLADHYSHCDGKVRRCGNSDRRVRCFRWHRAMFGLWHCCQLCRIAPMLTLSLTDASTLKFCGSSLLMWFQLMLSLQIWEASRWWQALRVPNQSIVFLVVSMVCSSDRTRVWFTKLRMYHFILGCCNNTRAVKYVTHRIMLGQVCIQEGRYYMATVQTIRCA